MAFFSVIENNICYLLYYTITEREMQIKKAPKIDAVGGGKSYCMVLSMRFIVYFLQNHSYQIVSRHIFL